MADNPQGHTQDGHHLTVGNGHEIYWTERGSSNGAPLLLVHGGNGYTFDEDRLKVLEATGRRLIIMHQRGIGRSQPVGKTEDNNIQDNIDDIEALRAHLNLESLDILSWSFGSVFAAGYALQYPERCDSLICYAPYLGSEEDYKIIARTAPEQAQSYYKFHGTKSSRGIVKSVFNKAAAPDLKTKFESYYKAVSMMSDEPLDKETVFHSKTPAQWDRFFKMRYVSAKHDLELHTDKRRFLETLSRPENNRPPVPVMMIYGDRDTWSGPTEYARTVFPFHRRVAVTGAGHDIHQPAVLKTLASLLAPPKPGRDVTQSPGPQI